MAISFNGTKMKKLREEHNMSQYQMGNMCDVDARYIRFLESGQRDNPSAILVYRFSKALGVSMEELIEDDEIPE